MLYLKGMGTWKSKRTANAKEAESEAVAEDKGDNIWVLESRLYKNVVGW